MYVIRIVLIYKDMSYYFFLILNVLATIQIYYLCRSIPTFYVGIDV
jgi:hypothetical protein